MRISDWSSDVCSSDLAGEIEPLDSLRAADDFVIAMPPAKPEQVIVERLGENPHLVAIGIDAERAVALRQLRAVAAVDQRDMRIGGFRPDRKITRLNSSH